MNKLPNTNTLISPFEEPGNNKESAGNNKKGSQKKKKKKNILIKLNLKNCILNGMIPMLLALVFLHMSILQMKMYLKIQMTTKLNG
jgi:hypothetical protein